MAHCALGRHLWLLHLELPWRTNGEATRGRGKSVAPSLVRPNPWFADQARPPTAFSLAGRVANQGVLRSVEQASSVNNRPCRPNRLRSQQTSILVEGMIHGPLFLWHVAHYLVSRFPALVGPLIQGMTRVVLRFVKTLNLGSCLAT